MNQPLEQKGAVVRAILAQKLLVLSHLHILCFLKMQHNHLVYRYVKTTASSLKQSNASHSV
jgi:hypothetical protein